MSEISFNIEDINKILSDKKLAIPDYQRPYKWERKNIRNLFYDITDAMKKGQSEYRIGSIILHQEDEKTINIVDGQQRLISISLFFYYALENELPIGSKNLLESKNYINISRKNAKENYKQWQELCSQLNKDELEKLCKYINFSCKFAVIMLPKEKLAEAFQLFDSQNNRGKALESYDLLKAYHLREMDNPTAETIKKWEMFVDSDTFNLKMLFDKHLFRIRRWSNGDTGLYKKKHNSELRFSERFIDDFKGVKLKSGTYPYLKLYAEMKEKNISFPNSLVMPIIDGEAFFKFIEYSYQMFYDYFYSDKDTEKQYCEDREINAILNSKRSVYSGNINLYVNLISLFIDRFGKCELNTEVCRKIFIWSFYPRIKAKAIYTSTIANYAAGGMYMGNTKHQKMFQLLNNSPTPRSFIASINTELTENKSCQDIIEALKKKGS